MKDFNQFKEFYISTMNETRQKVLSYDWQNKVFYTGWVGQIYHFLCHSTRMIPFAASQFDQTDEVYFNRCIEHSHEEKGHQMMAINDLKALGSYPLEHPMLPPTEQLYAYPYFVIEKEDPIAIFGISAYMEGLSIEMGKPVTEKVIQAFGKRAASFLISHTHDDEDHIQEVFGALQSMPATRLNVVQRVFSGSNDNFLKTLELLAQKTLG